jgi:hypothetical protein
LQIIAEAAHNHQARVEPHTQGQDTPCERCLQKAAQPEAFTTRFIAIDYGHRFG